MAFEGTAFIEKEGKVYVARCPELGVRSEAGSMLEVLDQLRADVLTFLQRESPEPVSPEDVRLSVMRVEVDL